ncbi:MAG: hypothetical protein BWK79_15895 [Beggiatoa sp. IS2]|nr:MAG: hypothetical protein BWK79_15895 [Beggiatoa sp. IS2]
MPKKTWIISSLSLPLLFTFSLSGCANPYATNPEESEVDQKATVEKNSPQSVTVSAETPPVPANVTAKKQTEMVTTSINAFTNQLYSQLNLKKENLFLSPYSVATALAMTYVGAEATTKTQMAQTLQFGTANTPDILLGFSGLQKSFVRIDANYELNITNHLWVQKGTSLVADFTEQLGDAEIAVPKTANFQKEPEIARTQINDHIAEQTRQKIKDLLTPGLVTSNTRLVLTNAIYFKGKWQTPFNKASTEEQDFLKLDNTSIKVPTMYQKGQFRYFSDNDAQLIELPYQSSEGNPGLSMVVLLPQKNENFEATEKKLSHYLQKLAKNDSPVEIMVFLPRFKLESAFQLQEPLKKMGMEDAFDPAKANFKGMIKDEKLAISAVVHKAFIEVNEEGSEAAAATAVVTSRGMSPTFRANHPFIFWIKDNSTGTILFLGKVLEPNK